MRGVNLLYGKNSRLIGYCVLAMGSTPPVLAEELPERKKRKLLRPINVSIQSQAAEVNTN
jgi:hypothetical protein